LALSLGELSIALELENSALRTGMAQAKREIQTLSPAAQQEMTKVSRVMQTEGQKAGGKLSQGINAGLIRNSPLIVAGVSAALAAGAPVLTAAATTMFAGIGIAAAAQSTEVQQAWVGLWDDVKNSAIDDAEALQEPLVAAAGRIGGAFERMRPQLRSAFEGSAPLIDSVTDGVIALAENAMPGLLSAVESSGPVMNGLESLLSDLGTGFGEMFGALGEHGPAAGAALEAIGGAVAELLPTVGELLGGGAELASIVLPPLVTGLGAVADVAEDLGPLLPIIAAGFIGLRIANSVATGVGSLAGRMDDVATRGGRFGGVMGSAAGATKTFSSALPVVGAGLAVLGAAYARNQQNINEWSQAILDGGSAAKTALQNAAMEGGVVEGVSRSFYGLGEAMDLFTTDSEEAAQASRDLYDSMTEGQQAAQDVTKAQNDLALAVSEYGAASPQAEWASNALTTAQERQERAASELEMAQRGVTSAMVEQANQALAAIDSGFAYQNSLNQLEDAQSALAEAQAHVNDTNEETRTSSEDVSRAQLGLSEQAYATAQAFGRQQADLSGLEAGTTEYTRLLQTSTLQELYRLRDAAGPEMAGALSQQISMLEASGVSLGETSVAAGATRDRMRDLGHSVTEVPGFKGVKIDAPTEDQRRRIEDLGYKVVNLPDGSVYVTADTADAEAALNNVARSRTATIYTNTVVRSGQQATGRGLVEANGGIVHQYAAGGVELSPMQGGVAQVVGPNTWRVIGDRAKDDEAYIPLNGDRRSQEILAIAANRMGYELVRGMADGGVVRYGTVSQGEWDRLLSLGWKGNPNDKMEALYAPVARPTIAPAPLPMPRPAPPVPATAGGLMQIAGTITGRLALDKDGWVRLVDARIEASNTITATAQRQRDAELARGY